LVLKMEFYDNFASIMGQQLKLEFGYLEKLHFFIPYSPKVKVFVITVVELFVIDQGII
jgi:hypothetical protein